MRILNTLLCGLTSIVILAAPGVAAARDDVYFNFGYSNGYPARYYYPAQRTYYYAPPVVVAPPVYHHYYSPAPDYYYGERCPPRRYHSLNRHRYRDDWGPRYSYRDRRYGDRGWYR